MFYFSATSIILVGVLMLTIYWLFSEYREEDFQQRQKDKIITTLHFISEIEKDKSQLAEAINRLKINSFFDDKLLIFDSNKKLIYSSLGDVPITYSGKLLDELNEENYWIEQKDGLYDIVAIYFKSKDKSYYGISKAYDEFGYTKLNFLRTVLIVSFLVFATLIIVLSVYIANRIAKPISGLAGLLSKYRIGEPFAGNTEKTHTFEIDYLNLKFNELVTRTNNAYTFQKNSVHHISHQLKTPIAVLISELERIKKSASTEYIQQEIDKQIAKARSLAEIINTLLEISKIESEQSSEKHPIRTDEIIFDGIDELQTLYPDFVFEVNYIPAQPNDNALIIYGNEMLIRQVFQNLLSNCISYSTNHKSEIRIDTSDEGKLKISVMNKGIPVSKEEEKYLFTHFFRGENSRDKIGFGLGLTLTKTIVELHNGSISYSSHDKNTILFEVIFSNTLS